jgi:hypothetical protein
MNNGGNRARGQSIVSKQATGGFAGLGNSLVLASVHGPIPVLALHER